MLFLILHTYAGGVGAYHIVSDTVPNEEEMIKHFDISYEPDLGEKIFINPVTMLSIDVKGSYMKETHVALAIIQGCTRTQACQVMSERIGHDEDYGFPYKIHAVLPNDNIQEPAVLLTPMGEGGEANRPIVNGLSTPFYPG